MGESERCARPDMADLIIAVVFLVVVGTAVGVWWLTSDTTSLILGALWIVGFVGCLIEGVEP